MVVPGNDFLVFWLVEFVGCSLHSVNRVVIDITDGFYLVCSHGLGRCLFSCFAVPFFLVLVCTCGLGRCGLWAGCW